MSIKIIAKKVIDLANIDLNIDNKEEEEEDRWSIYIDTRGGEDGGEAFASALHALPPLPSLALFCIYVDIEVGRGRRWDICVTKDEEGGGREDKWGSIDMINRSQNPSQNDNSQSDDLSFFRRLAHHIHHRHIFDTLSHHHGVEGK